MGKLVIITCKKKNTDGNEDDPKIIKANGKKISECLVPYRSYHNHEPMSNEHCTQVLRTCF